MKLLRKLFRRRKNLHLVAVGFEKGWSAGYRSGLLKGRTELTKLLADACQCDDEWTCQATEIERQLRTLLGKAAA